MTYTRNSGVYGQTDWRTVFYIKSFRYSFGSCRDNGLCDEASAKWAMVEQDVCQRDPFESMKMSYDYLATKGFC